MEIGLLKRELASRPRTAGVEVQPSINRSPPTTEFEQRISRAQKKMASAHPLPIDALLLTTAVDVEYFSGLESQFWHSPTRPICFIIRREAPPTAVVPDIMASAMKATWVADVVAWPSIEETIVPTLRAQLKGASVIATPMAIESHVRMPLGQLDQLRQEHDGASLPHQSWVDGSSIVHGLLLVKSDIEISFVRRACKIASAVFDHLSDSPYLGKTERDVARDIRIALERGGADSVPFVVVASGRDGYESLVVGPTDRPLAKGDVLAIDVGCTFAGYWSDFNRNFAISTASAVTQNAHRLLWDATEAALSAVKPHSQTFGGLWEVMVKVMVRGGCDPSDYLTGRMGHGLGRTLTELPSIARGDMAPLQPGVVFTLEPTMRLPNGQEMVHEECLVVTESGYSLLTTRGPREIPVLEVPAAK
jgi:Xaa-Pro aminopeptidase